MYYIVYKTINNINGKVYYGAHKSKNLHDEYLGSGKILKRAIKKYREIIKQFDTEEAMYLYERELITESVVKDKNTYNQTIGGRGGFSHIDMQGDKNPMKRKDVIIKI